LPTHIPCHTGYPHRRKLTLCNDRLPWHDFVATKLKAILDRAEAKDYRDISAMLSAGVSLEKALGAFANMYRKDPGLPLRAMGFFKDGDLLSLAKSDQDILRNARDRVIEISDVVITRGPFAMRMVRR
jgi:hypothetical protein